MMKRMMMMIILILFMLSCENSKQKSQEERWSYHPDISENSVQDLSFLTHKIAVAAGANGTVHRTLNGGKTWQTFEVGVSETFVKSFILSKDHFYVSRLGLYETTDGGETFTELGELSQTASTIFAMHFFNENDGVIQKGHQILRTTDGGQNWDIVYHQANFPRRMQFLNDQVGYVSGGISYDGRSIGELHKTEDGGKTWKNISFQSLEIMAMHFIDETVGYITTMDHDFLVTRDGGQTWKAKPQNVYQRALGLDLLFLDENKGFTISTSGLFSTEDGGSTWQQELFSSSDMPLSKIVVSPNRNIYILSGNGAYSRQGIKTQF